MTGPFRLLPEPAVLFPDADVPASLRRLADELEDGSAETVLVVLSGPKLGPLPSVRVYGREVRWAEVDGLLLQAAMLPPC